MGEFLDEEVGYDESAAAEVASMPWIDVHQHTQTLTWSDHDKFDLSGARAVVAIATNYHYTPYRPVRPDDVRRLWDDAIKRSHSVSRCHLFDQYVAISIRTWLSRVDDYRDLLAIMPEYAALDEVVAIGEVGINLDQFPEKWGIESQADVVRGQFHVANRAGLPVIVHLPAPHSSTSPPRWTVAEHGHDAGDPGFEADDERVAAVERIVELIDEVGIAQDRVIVDHMHQSVLPTVMESTDCSVGFSMGYRDVGLGTTKDVDPGVVAAAIDEYGSERIVIDSDAAGCLNADPFAMKRTMITLSKLGVDVEDVRAVAYENPRRLLDLPA